MPRYLKQSTAATVIVGQFRDATDGKTAETAFDVTTVECDIFKGASKTDVTLSASGGNNDMVHVANGYWSVELTTTDTNTLGDFRAVFILNGTFWPVEEIFTVLPANVYDSLIAGTDVFQTHTVEMTAGVITATVVADGTIDAATFTTGAINAAALAADAGAKIADAVWDEARSGHATAGTFGEGVASVQGNVTGSVGSVTGAVGSVTGNVGGSVASVTGAVGSVTGNVGGNVTGSVDSVVGAVGSVTGNLGGSVVGNVNGTVGSVVGNVGGNVVGNVNGSVASVAGNVSGNVTGTVGGVSGNIGGNVNGNVTGSVGSVTTVSAGAITSGSFATGAITAGVIATDAIGSAEVSDAAAAKIGGFAAPLVWDEFLPAHVTAGTFGAGVIVAQNDDKTGYALSASGLDSISTTAPSGVAANFREMAVQVWRRLFKKATMTATELKTFADNGSTVLTTQTLSDDGTTQTQGAAS